MRKRKKISLDDVCSGKEALRKGTEALNKSNQIMSNTTISADEGHFELAKSICMANNHIPLQLQIIQPFLPDEAGIFLWLVSIPSEAVSRIPASRPSTSWWYPPPANPRVLPALSCGWPVLPSFTTWHWQHGRVALGVLSLESDREGWGKREKGLFLSPGRQKDADRIHVSITDWFHLGCLWCWCCSFLLKAQGGMCSLSQTVQERRGGQQLPRSASMAGASCVWCFVADTANGQCLPSLLDWLGAGSCKPDLLKCTAEKPLSTWELQDMALLLCGCAAFRTRAGELASDRGSGRTEQFNKECNDNHWKHHTSRCDPMWHPHGSGAVNTGWTQQAGFLFVWTLSQCLWLLTMASACKGKSVTTLFCYSCRPSRGTAVPPSQDTFAQCLCNLGGNV